MRLINTGVYSNMRFSIDNHTLTVISMDFIPIVPYKTDNVGPSFHIFTLPYSQYSGRHQHGPTLRRHCRSRCRRR
jgi:hypothetical protein